MEYLYTQDQDNYPYEYNMNNINYFYSSPQPIMNIDSNCYNNQKQVYDGYNSNIDYYFSTVSSPQSTLEYDPSYSSPESYSSDHFIDSTSIAQENLFYTSTLENDIFATSNVTNTFSTTINLRDNLYIHQDLYLSPSTSLSGIDSSSSLTAVSLVTDHSDKISSVYAKTKNSDQINLDDGGFGGGKQRVTKSTRAKRNEVIGITKKNKQQKNKQESPKKKDADSKKFKCECGKEFKRSEHLKRHVKSIHTKIKDFCCTFPGCARSFARSDNLNQHLRTHRNDKKKQ